MACFMASLVNPQVARMQVTEERYGLDSPVTNLFHGMDIQYDVNFSRASGWIEGSLQLYVMCYYGHYYIMYGKNSPLYRAQEVNFWDDRLGLIVDNFRNWFRNVSPGDLLRMLPVELFLEDNWGAYVVYMQKYPAIDALLKSDPLIGATWSTENHARIWNAACDSGIANKIVTKYCMNIAKFQVYMEKCGINLLEGFVLLHDNIAFCEEFPSGHEAWGGNPNVYEDYMLEKTKRQHKAMKNMMKGSLNMIQILSADLVCPSTFRLILRNIMLHDKYDEIMNVIMKIRINGNTAWDLARYLRAKMLELSVDMRLNLSWHLMPCSDGRS